MKQVIPTLSGNEMLVKITITNILHSVGKAEMIRKRRVHTQILMVVSNKQSSHKHTNGRETQGRHAQKTTLDE